MGTPYNVLLLIESSSTFARRLIRGITFYSQKHGPWRMTLREGDAKAVLAALRRPISFDGIIARVESEAARRALTRLQLPVINVSGAGFSDHVPWIDVDNESVIRLVVDDFVERRLAAFAFCGIANRTWSVERERIFRRQLAERRFDCKTLRLANQPATDDYSYHIRISGWLNDLSKPVGVMAANDACGYAVLRGCYVADLAAPEEVAVIGVNNDELLCELSYPTLSSVSTNIEQIGYRSAELLHQLISGQSAGVPVVKVKPLGLETRNSTDTAAVADPFIRLALRFVQQHACDGINVNEVLKAVPLSRTALETGFRDVVGRSPHAEISRTRIRRACQLLAGSSLSMGEIAARCGYRSGEYFCIAFKREMGMPPGVYRAAGETGGQKRKG